MSHVIAQCERCNSPIEQGDLRCAICGAVAPDDREDPSEVAVQVLRCERCGATVNYDPAIQAPRCAFCDSRQKLESIEDPMEQTERFLPFTVDQDQARDALKRWLGSLGFFRPSDLRSQARLASLKPLWWVGWCFDAKALVSWTADSNAGARRADWAPHAGQVVMEFDDLVVSASRGLTEAETAFSIPYYDVSTIREEPLGAGDPRSAVIEQFDVQRSQARRWILKAIDAVAENRLLGGPIPGSRHRNLHLTVLLKELVTRRYAFPSYVLAYRYKDRLYRAVVCGQDARAVTGHAPISWAKVALVVGLAIMVILILVAIATG